MDTQQAHRYIELRKARDARNLTNAELSRLIGKSESLISKIMSGQRTGRYVMADLCRVLGIPEVSDRKLKAK